MTLPLTIGQRILVAVCLVFLTAAVVLFFQYRANEGQKARLDAQLATAQAQVAKINQARRSASASDPLLRTPAFPQKSPDLALASAVLANATGSGVNAGPIQTTTGESEKIGNNTYQKTVLSLTISGSLPRILNFFDRMEHTGLRTVTFDNIRFRPGNGQWIVQMQIIAYAQPE